MEKKRKSVWYWAALIGGVLSFLALIGKVMTEQVFNTYDAAFHCIANFVIYTLVSALVIGIVRKAAGGGRNQDVSQ